ncbi:hypothetical protein [Paenibacillus sp. FSL K6-0108]|uniref:hypothetical protein n=1 Tax=Paenibacillus sp. FSL K6-0108 TaxID=2921417 RepID=UPI003247ECEB
MPSNAFNVFFIKQFMESNIPDKIIESAGIDSAGEFLTFNQIVLPILGPAISTLLHRSCYLCLDKYPLPVLVTLVHGYYNSPSSPNKLSAKG